MDEAGKDRELRLERRAAPGLVLMTGRGAYRILDLKPDSCLIEAPRGTALRGYADIYHGERQMARCLIVLAAAEGEVQRCIFKRRTDARAAPPVDYAV